MTEKEASASDPALRAEIDRQKHLLLRGAVDLLSEAELDRKLARSLKEGRPLRVKLGVDPTSPLLHLGFTVVLNKLRTFQDLGHQAVLIIGDATALVGDPTGRNKTRPRLEPEEVARHAAGYLEQAGKILALAKAEIRRNSEWLGKLDFLGMIGLCAKTTVARLLERDDFSKRYRDGVAIHLHELIYPLLQGYDSVVVRADVELGGTDQLFNLLVGRDLQSEAGQEPQVCLTTPLLVGLDGKQKMSKSYGNTVGIAETPDEMMTKIMRLDDALMKDWFTLVTRVPLEELGVVLGPSRNPRDAKLDLGRAIIRLYHGEGAAEAAAGAWLRVVSEKALPAELQELTLDARGLPAATPEAREHPLIVLNALMATGWFASRSEARRLVAQGGVSLDGIKLVDPLAPLAEPQDGILRAGKQKVAKIRILR